MKYTKLGYRKAEERRSIRARYMIMSRVFWSDDCLFTFCAAYRTNPFPVENNCQLRIRQKGGTSFLIISVFANFLALWVIYFQGIFLSRNWSKLSMAFHYSHHLLLPWAVHGPIWTGTFRIILPFHHFQGPKLDVHDEVLLVLVHWYVFFSYYQAYMYK